MPPNSYKQQPHFDTAEFEMQDKVPDGGGEKGGGKAAEGGGGGGDEKEGGDKKRPPSLPPVGVGQLFKYADKLDTFLIIGRNQITGYIDCNIRKLSRTFHPLLWHFQRKTYILPLKKCIYFFAYFVCNNY